MSEAFRIDINTYPNLPIFPFSPTVCVPQPPALLRDIEAIGSLYCILEMMHMLRESSK
jgi:hypothetical protein